MPPDFNSLGRLVSAAIEERVIPGLAIAVAHEGQARLQAAYGLRQIEPAPLPASLATVYDLASLTKALVTSVLVMKGVERGRLHLDGPMGEHLPELADRPAATLRRALAHAAGFAAHRKFYEKLFAENGPAPAHRAAVVAAAAAEPLAYEPGGRSLYSDLGFILLGALVERALGARLDVLAASEVFRPLGLAGLRFVELPGAHPGPEVAPTERCAVRGRMVAGEVHDLNAYAMGGIAGHAGLFGSVGDVLQLALALGAAYHGRGLGGAAPLLDAAVLREFWRPSGVAGSTWRLGWDGPAAQGSLAGSLLARGAVGHLSFSGCSLWLDPEQETCVVVLCNRIHPEARDDPRFRALRPRICDEALRAIGYQAR
ncbi:MAG: serine hydrolase [Deltaproteobacteria bacterium]|nr:serine hydrolase [Deltaproteobacteria bacterium]